MTDEVGITEGSDPSIETKNWQHWVFEQERPAILISKDPLQMFKHLQNNATANIIIHCTITGLAKTALEPNIPSLESSIHGFFRLAKLFGPERVVLRIDPIFPYGKFLAKAIGVHKEVSSKWEKRYSGTKLRVRISFMDMYPHVQARFAKLGVTIPWGNNFHAPLARRSLVWRHLGQPEVCGEPEMAVTGCISDLDLDILGVKKRSTAVTGQRRACACLSVKRELQPRGQCAFKCAYCYWRKTPWRKRFLEI
jgi:DNA repair photolyase